MSGATQFEVEWFGGPAERRLRRRRPGVDALPWGTLALDAYSPAAIAEARKVWTNGAFTEYASAAGFTALTTALLECGAPIDLTAAAADFAVDELDHTELAARLAAELGGAVPYEVDLGEVSPFTTPGASPLVRAAELAIKTSCVGEALSVPVIAESLEVANQPLVRAVLERLLHDEGPHAKLGHWFFEWASPRLTQSELHHLGEISLETLEVYAPLWRIDPCSQCPPAPELGATTHRETLRIAARDRVVAPLRRWGVELDSARVEDLIGCADGSNRCKIAATVRAG
ncbi:MAG: ferritin-like domain-containing protein [Polyangiaceae bacterium]